jgi:subtilisin family serine protease
MAAPHVAGAVALQLASSRSTSAQVVSTAITGSASLNRVGDPGPGSLNRLLYIGTAIDTEAPVTPAPAAPAPAAPTVAKSPQGTTLGALDVRPRVAAATRTGETMVLTLPSVKGAVYKVYRDGKLTLTTRSSRPKVQVGKGKRIVFQVRTVTPNGLSAWSNKVIVVGSRVIVKAR